MVIQSTHVHMIRLVLMALIDANPSVDPGWTCWTSMLGCGLYLKQNYNEALLGTSRKCIHHIENKVDEYDVGGIKGWGAKVIFFLHE